MRIRSVALPVMLLLLAGHSAAQSKGRAIEEIIARINNDIITLSDYQKGLGALRDEVKQDCANCPPAQIATEFENRKKDVLRDLIDQSLLVQKAKDEGISVETEVVKRLDQVRQQNKLASMEDLEKAVEASGVAFEDYKANLRNNLLTQEIIRREVGSRIVIDNEEVKKYYEDHKKEFVRPEMVYLREIFVSTEGKKPEEIPALEEKAKALLDRIKKGEDFVQLAKHFSDGSTAQDGGELGGFERGQLAKEIEDVVFKLNRNDITDVVHTKQGLEILQVEEHFQAGQQPLEKVENEIMNRLYMQKMQPTLRDYLTQLREESYVVVKPGYLDTAAVGATPIQETAPTPDQGKGKKGKSKKRARG